MCNLFLQALTHLAATRALRLRDVSRALQLALRPLPLPYVAPPAGPAGTGNQIFNPSLPTFNLAGSASTACLSMAEALVRSGHLREALQCLQKWPTPPQPAHASRLAALTLDLLTVAAAAGDDAAVEALRLQVEKTGPLACPLVPALLRLSRAPLGLKMALRLGHARGVVCTLLHTFAHAPHLALTKIP
jgi:hypothetical protein